MYCIVKGCTSTSQLLNFPRNFSLCQKWWDQLQNPNMAKSDPRLIRKYFRICADHFEIKYFEQINTIPLKLLPHAIPTLNLRPCNQVLETVNDLDIIEAYSYADNFTNKYKNFKLLYTPNINIMFNKAMGKMQAINQVCILSYQFLPLRTKCGNRLVVNELQALVFMIRGLHENWKQLLTYVFIETNSPKEHVAAYICDAIHTALSLFFDVVGIVCSPTKRNVDIMSLLKGTRVTYPEKKYEYIPFKNRDIIILYDPPQLLKQMRVDFASMDIKFYLDYKYYTASWEEIKNYHYYTVEHNCEFLTEKHIYVNELFNTVELSAQIFSNKLGKNLLIHSLQFSGKKQSYCVGTGKFLMIMNKLFDSINGYASHSSKNKPLYCKVTRNSSHVDWWQKFADVIDSTVFLDVTSEIKTLSVEKLSSTLHGFKYLWKELCRRSFREFVPRRVNMDPLENDISRMRFFCCIDDIRQNSDSKKFFYPSSSEFVAGFCNVFNNGTNFLRPMYCTFLNPLYSVRGDLNFEINPNPSELPCLEDNCSSIITNSNFRDGEGYERISFLTLNKRPILKGCFMIKSYN